MPERWVRNLHVQVRLAYGRLALRLDEATVVLGPEEAAAWRSWTPVASPDESTSHGLTATEHAELWARLAEAGMITPEEAAR